MKKSSWVSEGEKDGNKTEDGKVDRVGKAGAGEGDDGSNPVTAECSPGARMGDDGGSGEKGGARAGAGKEYRVGKAGSGEIDGNCSSVAGEDGPRARIRDKDGESRCTG